MFRLSALWSCLLTLVLLACAPIASATLDVVGEYEGLYYCDLVSTLNVTACVVEEGTDHYRVRFVGKPQASHEDGIFVEINGSPDPAGNGILLEGDCGGRHWTGSIVEGHLTATANYFELRFDLNKIVRHSPTEGQEPPAGAVVLLAYEPNVPPDLSAWDNPNWTAESDGSMRVGQGDTKSHRQFRDIQMHMEFLCPFNPDSRDQARSNSGVILYGQYAYEIQILDSFGLIPTREDCGGLCPIAKPLVNASLPPGAWQTYDITLRAARTDEQGAIVESPRITVLHNGILIHDDVELSAGAPHGGPIHFQYHGDPGDQVRFRNIWIIEPTEGGAP
jgi:hypothetical protein